MIVELCEIPLTDAGAIVEFRRTRVVTHTKEYAAFVALCAGDRDYNIHFIAAGEQLTE